MPTHQPAAVQGYLGNRNPESRNPHRIWGLCALDLVPERPKNLELEKIDPGSLESSVVELQGYLAHRKRLLIGPYSTVGPYGGPRGGALSYERGTPELEVHPGPGKGHPLPEEKVTA